jgi:hypothetical protein
MTPLGVDFVAAAAVAACLGWAGPKSWKHAVGFCLLVGAFGWVGSYLAAFLSPSFGGDTEYAEDWINGFSVQRAAPEIAVALAWTFFWFGLTRVARMVIGRPREQASG